MHTVIKQLCPLHVHASQYVQFNKGVTMYMYMYICIALTITIHIL